MATKSTVPPLERAVNGLPAAERQHLEVVIDNLLDAEVEVDDAREAVEAAQHRLKGALARRDDLQHQTEVILTDAQPPAESA
jgi:hypothetical protein